MDGEMTPGMAWRWRTRGSEAGSLRHGWHRGHRRAGRDRYLYRAAAAGAAHRPGRQGQLPARRQPGPGRFLDSTGLGVLAGGLRRVRARDGSLDLVCTRPRILKILRITELTEVFGIYETVDQAIAAAKGRR